MKGLDKLSELEARLRAAEEWAAEANVSEWLTELQDMLRQAQVLVANDMILARNEEPSQLQVRLPRYLPVLDPEPLQVSQSNPDMYEFKLKWQADPHSYEQFTIPIDLVKVVLRRYLLAEQQAILTQRCKQVDHG